MLYQKVLYLFVQEISRKYLNFWYYRNELDWSGKTFLFENISVLNSSAAAPISNV